jgi:hypothetical protein
MTTTEKIKKIEHELFIMEFKDHWTPADWAERNRLNKELAELKAQ